jgi:hypothetical protein
MAGKTMPGNILKVPELMLEIKAMITILRMKAANYHISAMFMISYEIVKSDDLFLCFNIRSLK